MSKQALSEQQKMFLVNDLALARCTQKDLAIRYDVSPAYITQFKKAHMHEIRQVIIQSLDHITSEQIKQSDWRMKEYARDLEKLDGVISPEFVRVRAQILHQASEELGQMPPRMTIQVQPVVHIIRGIDLDTAFPPMITDSSQPQRNNAIDSDVVDAEVISDTETTDAALPARNSGNVHEN